ncbi:MAG TPA: hypothetical protein PKL15_13315, partial [Saprospiraceae bacterium]|nr:hypothetical protein [Saprospiraceae bacterium]
MHKANNTSLPAHENTRAAASQPVQQVTHAPSPLQSAVETGDEEQEAPPALSTVYAPLQFKLTANTPGDHYEQEAEQIAETVVSGAQSPSIQRAAAPDVKAEED